MKRLKLILLFLISSVFAVYAGTTGKIAGIVTEKSTGNPIPGANIIIVGTSLGAASNINGEYTILYVPPGAYDMQVSVIGFRKVIVNNVRVFIDQTARIDVSLEEETIRVDEVIVVAERNLIKPDVATSVVSVSGEELKDLPIDNVQDVLGMQAGIGTDGRDFFIRGSGGNQSLFLIDGITMRDPRNNQAITKVALSTIKEISIERGGFNAEYGQVQAGIVNVVTNEGEELSYSGSIQVRVAPPAPKYYRGNGIPDIHDPDSYWMRPYLDPEVAWTGTTTPESEGGWDEYTRSKYLQFVGWNAVSEQLNTDNNPDNDLTPEGAQRAFLYETRKKQNNQLADYDIDAGFGGPVPFVSQAFGNLRFFASYRRNREVLLFPQTRPDYMDEDGRLVFNADISNSMRLKFTGAIGNIATMEENWNKGFYPRFPRDIAGGTGGFALFNLFSDWAYSLTDISHHNFSGKFTHNLNNTTFYEVSLEYIRTHYFSRAPEPRDITKLYEVIPGFYETSNPLGYNPNASSNDGIIIWAGEQQSLARDNSIATATTLKADMTSQINFNNLLKGGIEIAYNDINLDYGYIQMQTGGETYASRVQMDNFPVRGAAYIQDKLETKGFTLNAGLRLDYSNSRVEWWDFNPYDINFISNKYNSQRIFTLQKSEGQWQLSPRLGISHPITENSKLFFNYGHFKQMPQYETLFRLDRRPDNTLVRIGDPNMTLGRTISYELGFDYLFPENVLLQITAFYRDLSDQPTVNPRDNTQGTRYQSIGGAAYTIASTDSYSDIRGFEVTLRKSAGQWFNGFINYTYQVTSNGNFGAAQLYEDPALQKNYDENTINLYQTRPVPTPNAKANLTFFSPDDFGPRFLSQSILGGWSLNLLLNWSQGGYTTYNPKNTSGIANNVQYVDFIDGTLRLTKTFLFPSFQVQLFADMNNLFNNLRMWNTGDQDYRESLHLPKNKGYDNIPGDDKFGDYREPGVEWQPMEYMGRVDFTSIPGPARETGTSPAIYYDASTEQYWQYTNNQWSQVDQARIDQINKDKAYINMPGASTFWFLNPRQIFFGLRVSFNLD
jgi:outer membrane receptor protein involved in Fe transport